MAGVTIRDAAKRFGDVPVLHGIDLDCPDGAYVCLLGPSGCGKSTLLRLTAGLETLDRGRIAIGERRVDGLLPGDRGVGFAFQNYALYPHLDVRANLAFPLRAPRRKREYDEARIAERVRTTAAMLELEGLLDRPVTALSGGQKQRVALGRALIREPAVLLLDEPITHLDARLRHAMRRELKLLHQRQGTTTIHVTHDQAEAMALADRIVVMREGRVEQVGTPAELYADPATAFIAGFVGDPPMSLLAGTLDPAAGGVRIGDVVLGLDATAPAGTVLVGLRTAAVQIADDGPVRGTLLAHEWIGREQQLTVAVGASRLRVRTSDPRRHAVGETLPLVIDAGEAVLFDPETGRRLGFRPDH